MKKWTVVIALSAAQFVMILDSTVMNVSIDEVVTDLDTTVTKMQLAITTYTLVMAALMMLGGKLGDIFGRRRMFRLGLVLFATGAGITAAAPNIGTLIFGWSIVEGLGATLMIPAVAALVAGNYTGRDRAMCFGIIGGVAAAGAAAGPIIGGWAATAISWRVVFAAEVVIMAGLLLTSKVIRDTPRADPRPHLDGVGAALSASGLGLAVLGIVQSTDWGWVNPKGALTIAGHQITPFGFSIVPFLILGGVLLLMLFSTWEKRRTRLGQTPLVQLPLLKIPRLRAGLQTMLMMQLTLAGTFFVLPLYLQIVLGNDPFDTGLKILPLSIGLFVVSLGAARLSTWVAPRLIVQCGLGAMLVGVAILLTTIRPSLDTVPFGLSMVIIGVGLGCLASQLGNINLSSVGPADTSEVGGLQGTAQNLGAALGTALIGSILLTGLTGMFQSNVASNPDIPVAVQQQIAASTTDGVPFVPAATVSQTATNAGLPADEVASLTQGYEDSQLHALKAALVGVGALVLVAFWFTRHLPTAKIPRNDPGSAPGGDPGHGHEPGKAPAPA